MSTSLKTAILIFIPGLIIFWIIKPKAGSESKEKKPATREPLAIPKINEEDLSKHSRAEDALAALKAYVMAYNAGEDKYTLDEIVTEVKTEMGLIIYEKANGRIAVKDIEGYDIIISQ